MESEYIESFVILAAEQHFGHAAVVLHLSTSGLSKRIERLEASLGVRLIERDTGGCVGLTRAGVSFLEASHGLLRAVRHARQVALEPEKASIVHLGMPGLPTDHFPKAMWNLLVTGFKDRFPSCRISFRIVPYALTSQSILSGWVDVLLDSAFIDNDTLECLQLGSSGRVLLIPRHHVFHGTQALSLTDVADEPLIRDPRIPKHWMAPWLLRDLRGETDTRKVNVEARGLSDIENAVASGQGAAVTSEFVQISHPEVEAILISDAPSVPLYCFRRRADERETTLALFQTLQLLSMPLIRHYHTDKVRSEKL